MMLSSGTNVCSRISTKRGSTSFGTFTRAKLSTPDSGSLSETARLSDRLEMYGNGRPGPTPSGVSAGKICSWKRLSMAARSSSSQSSQVTMLIPCSASAGTITSWNSREWRL